MMMKSTLLERIRHTLSPKDSKELETKIAILRIRGEKRETLKALKNPKGK